MSLRVFTVIMLLAAALAFVAAAAFAESVVDAGRETAEAAMRAHEYRKALAWYDDAVRSAPDDASLHLARGDAATRLGELDQALEAYRTAVRIEPSPAHHAKLAAAAERLGRATEAIAAYRASLSADWPGRNTVAESFLLVLVNEDERAAALELARAEGWLAAGRDYCRDPVAGLSPSNAMLLAFLVHPTRADCLVEVAAALTEAGYTRLPRRLLRGLIAQTSSTFARERAEAFLRARLPAHDVPTRAEALNGAGFSLARHGQDADAITAYEKAMTADPRFSWPPSNLARVHIKRKDYAQALEWLRKAVALNPNHLRAVQNLGWTLNELGRSDEALDVYARALALDPDDAWTHASRGWALITLGREREGVQALQTSLRIDPAQERVRSYMNARFGADPRFGPTPFGAR